MFAAYDKGEIGALDCDEIEGSMQTNDERILDLANRHEENIKAAEADDELRRRILDLAENSDEEKDIVELPCKKQEWDCESILSTYSNIYNHPTKIIEPKVSTVRYSILLHFITEVDVSCIFYV